MISRTKRGYKIVAYLPEPVPRQASKATAKMPIHVQFANLHDDPKAFRLFKSRWGPLTRMGDAEHEAELGLRDRLREAWGGEENAWSNPKRPLSARLTLGKDRFEIQLPELYQTIGILFQRDFWAGKTAICANPDCLTPYFVKRRKNQRYCESGACTAQAQREQKRLWWQRNRGKGAEE